jgi:hypothetical protein
MRVVDQPSRDCYAWKLPGSTAKVLAFQPLQREVSMRHQAVILALSVVAASPVFAQAVGTVANVTGVATVTTGSSGAAVVAGAPILNGSRVLTTSTGTVTLRMNNGCLVTVPASHAVTVQSSLTCEQLQARIQPVGASATSAMGANERFSAPSAPVAIWAAGALLFIIDAERGHDNDEPLSAR